MGIDKKSAVHICNVIRRQIQGTFHNFRPLIILYDGETKKAALERDSKSILKHPAGQKMLDYLRKIAKSNAAQNKSFFAGMSHHKNVIIPKLFVRHEFLAVFFVSISSFENEFSFKSQIYHLMWHALELQKDYLAKTTKSHFKPITKPNFFNEETYEVYDHVIRPKLSSGLLIKRNLMADTFAASLLFLQGDTNAIRKIAGIRMRQAFEAKEGLVAERFPFAVCHETLEFIFENNTHLNTRSISFVSQAIKIAEDVGENYIIPLTTQWKNFSQPAQHMAWVGFAPDIILGSCIYTGENPYVCNIGDLVAKNTEVEPEIVTTADFFNPFMAAEKSLKAHKAFCYDVFRKLLLDVSVTSDTKIFEQEARRQNQILQKGNPFGWCAHALQRMSDTYREEFAGRYDLSQKARIEELFEAAQAEIPYEVLLKFSIIIFQKRRAGSKMSTDDVIMLGSAVSDFALITRSFERSRTGVSDIFHLNSQL